MFPQHPKLRSKDVSLFSKCKTQYSCYNIFKQKVVCLNLILILTQNRGSFKQRLYVVFLESEVSLLGTVCSLLQTTITMFSRFVSVSVRLNSVFVKKKLKSNVLFWLKTCMLFVGLSSFKGTNTCIPAVCACNSCDSCISRIENQFPETQHDWLHYIHNFYVIANSCKSKPNVSFLSYNKETGS